MRFIFLLHLVHHTSDLTRSEFPFPWRYGPWHCFESKATVRVFLFRGQQDQRRWGQLSFLANQWALYFILERCLDWLPSRQYLDRNYKPVSNSTIQTANKRHVCLDFGCRSPPPVHHSATKMFCTMFGLFFLKKN